MSLAVAGGGLQWLQPAQEAAEQVEHEPDEEEAEAERPPMLNVLSRRSDLTQAHLGQGGFFAAEERSRSSKRWRHLGHANS